MSKIRADIYLSEKGFAQSRAQAQQMIMAGNVLANERPIIKASQEISDADIIRIKEKLPYVSRGALKLEKALNHFIINVQNKTFIDFGASTGGFTDILLQKGAKRVICVDVGYGQLAWKIRNDERVRVMERTNAIYLTPESLGEVYDGAVCDVSFISIKKILPVMDICTNENGFIVALIKPQFEAGRKAVGKNGIVTNKDIHTQVITDIVEFIEGKTNFSVLGIDYSPIKGQKGNIEYLLYASKNTDAVFDYSDVIATVEKANLEL